MENSSNTMDEVAGRVVFVQKMPFRCTLRSPFLLLLAALSSMVGCGGSEFDLVSVSGQVTLGGSPLQDAIVTFSPIGSGVGTASFGRTDSEGRYELRTLEGNLQGATAGGHRVSVSTITIPPDADETTEIPPEIVPMKYRNGSFKIEVPSEGTDAADIVMQTPKKRPSRRRR